MKCGIRSGGSREAKSSVANGQTVIGRTSATREEAERLMRTQAVLTT
jgi:hypothetical protein